MKGEEKVMKVKWVLGLKLLIIRCIEIMNWDEMGIRE